jgi:hypothetical protein
VATDSDDVRQRYRAKSEADADAAADRAAVSAAAERIEETHQNPGFAGELSEWDLDDDLAAELGPRADGVWVFGDRDVTEEELKLLNANRAERKITSRDPGDLLRRHPTVHAVMEGTEGTHDPDYRPPAEKADRWDLREAYRAATVRETLGIGGTGFHGLTTVRTERASYDDDAGESGGVKGRFKRFLK